MNLNKENNKLIHVIDDFLFYLVKFLSQIKFHSNNTNFFYKIQHSTNLKNFIGLAFFNGIGGLSLMITLIYLANYMGPSSFGSFSYYLAIGEVGSMIVRYGRDKSLLRDIISQKDDEGKKPFIILTFWVGLINLLLFIISITLLHTPLEIPLSIAPFLVIGGSCLVSLDFQPVYESLQEMSWHAIYNFIQKVIYICGLWVIMLFTNSHSLLYIGMILVFSWIIVLVIQFKEIKKTFSLNFYGYFKLADFFCHYKSGIYVALCTLISATYNPLIRMVLKWYSSDLSVGIFSAGLQIYGICMFFLMQLARIANPQIANMVAYKENRNIQISILWRYIKLTIFSVSPFVLIMLIIPSCVVDLLFSSQYKPLETILPYFGVYLLQYAIIIILMQFLIANRFDKQYLIIQIIGALATILSSIILIPKLDYVGAIISLILSYSLLLVLYGIYTLYILRNDE